MVGQTTAKNCQMTYCCQSKGEGDRGGERGGEGVRERERVREGSERERKGESEGGE